MTGCWSGSMAQTLFYSSFRVPFYPVFISISGESGYLINYVHAISAKRARVLIAFDCFLPLDARNVLLMTEFTPGYELQLTACVCSDVNSIQCFSHSRLSAFHMAGDLWRPTSLAYKIKTCERQQRYSSRLPRLLS
jgi:hypothetical protein